MGRVKDFVKKLRLDEMGVREDLPEHVRKTLPNFTKKEVEALKAFEERKRKPKNKLN
mgnify:CR=1 FL=1